MLSTGLPHLSRFLGQVPTNLAGMPDDWLFHKRIRNWAELNADSREHLKRCGAQQPFEAHQEGTRKSMNSIEGKRSTR